MFVDLLASFGGHPSAYAGDIQGVSNIDAPAGVRIEEAWLQQNLLDGRLSLLAGRFDVSAEFYRLQSATLFLNSSLGTGPECFLAHVGSASMASGLRVGAFPANVMVPVTDEAAMATPGEIETTASAIASRNVFPDTRMLGSLVSVARAATTRHSILVNCATIASIGVFAQANIGVSRCV